MSTVSLTAVPEHPQWSEGQEPELDDLGRAVAALVAGHPGVIRLLGSASVVERRTVLTVEVEDGDPSEPFRVKAQFQDLRTDACLAFHAPVRVQLAVAP